MQINNRGEVNYHDFIKTLRERQDIRTDVACKGICTVSGWNRFENGNRVAEKMLRDRMVARLGVAGKKYEDYLQPKDYEAWMQRMRIVAAIERKETKCARKELAAYEETCKRNSVNKQFILAMRYMIMMLEGAPEGELYEVIGQAVKRTVSNVKKALEGNQLLCDQEINLIAEQMRLAKPKKSQKDANIWRVMEYEKLLAYIDSSNWEELQKAKLYPKLACYIGQLLLERECSLQELRHGLDICHRAMELLRDTSRSFYLIELAEIREALALRLLALPLKAKERRALEQMLCENAAWSNALRALYEEHGLPAYMSDFGYLYYETECYNIVEIVEIRRRMLGLSRTTLANGICVDKTIVRIERENKNVSIEVTRRLFERLGLCEEYRRAQMVTTDMDVVNTYYSDLVRLVNRKEYRKALKCVRVLKSKLDLDLLFNRQEIERMENFVLYQSGKMDSAEFAARTLKVLSYTIDVLGIGKNKRLGVINEYYFTRAEMSCLHDLAFEVESEVSERCLKIIENMCFDALQERHTSVGILPYEYIMERLVSKMGDEKKYQESSKIGCVILKECLKHYRIDRIASLVYNQVWNYEQDCGNSICNPEYIEHKLHLCNHLSKLIKNYNEATFFQMKLDSGM